MEKRFKTGLVLGKFMPPHMGHLFLINTAIEQCEKVFVFVGSLENEPINGFLRWNWLKMIYANNTNVEIIHIQDKNPQKPEECDSLDTFYKKYWVPTVKSRISNLDVIFTSEDYGDEFAGYLGVKHVLVDRERKTYPVSGTMVRDTPYARWDYIPDVVKSYYTKRICIMGPESTGKSSLCKILANYFNVDYIEEYGRTYTENVKPAKDFVIDDFYQIACVHDSKILEAHADSTNKLLFIDTDALTTKIFGQMYLDNYSDTRIDEIIKYQWFDLILLLDVDVPWINDGTRDFPEERKKHFETIKNELDKLGRKYVIIKGNYTERFEQARQLCEELIK